MPPPLAYFLSWTCYGQRLHGDERGSVDARHNLPGTPLLPHDPMREQRARERMKGETVLLTQDMRVVVESAVVQLCMERRWMLAARNVRSTHAHVVVDCRGELSPERALAQFKARATHALRQAGLVAPDTRLWTHHGSTRWINTYPGLYGAIIYVNE